MENCSSTRRLVQISEADQKKFLFFNEVNNEKNHRIWLFRGFVGDDKLPIFCGEYNKTIIRIPLKQPEV